MPSSSGSSLHAACGFIFLMAWPLLWDAVTLTRLGPSTQDLVRRRYDLSVVLSLVQFQDEKHTLAA